MNREWNDWIESNCNSNSTMCLFDDSVFPSAEQAHEHMKNSHQFDLKLFSIQSRKLHHCFNSLLKDLEFYEIIRLVNYIRRCTSLYQCFSCLASFPSFPCLTQHLHESKHTTTLPDKTMSFWTDPQYLLPYFENDPLLMLDLDHESDTDDGTELLAEIFKKKW